MLSYFLSVWKTGSAVPPVYPAFRRFIFVRKKQKGGMPGSPFDRRSQMDGGQRAAAVTKLDGKCNLVIDKCEQMFYDDGKERLF